MTNAHSIEPLPGHRVVVASSREGNALLVFDLNRNDVPLARTPLVSAHGVVWDAARERLWAIGYDELCSYTLTDWQTDAPTLTRHAQFPLPAAGGHDLRAVPEGDDLLLTTQTSVLLFDRTTQQFRPHPLFTNPKAGLAAANSVKSVDVQPGSGRLVVGQWNTELLLLGPAATIDFAEYRPYKARWFPEPTP